MKVGERLTCPSCGQLNHWARPACRKCGAALGGQGDAKGPVYYRRVIGGSPRGPLKRCGGCGMNNRWTRRVCRVCRVRLVARPERPRAAVPWHEAVEADLRHAGRMADEWAAKVARAVATMHRWNKRERALAAKLAAGPQPQRPKKEKPPIRGIMLTAGTGTLDKEAP